MQIDSAPNINPAYSQSQPSPIAIVGMGCRFPKGLASIDKLLQARAISF
jgi:hypothetical protein